MDWCVLLIGSTGNQGQHYYIKKITRTEEHPGPAGWLPQFSSNREILAKKLTPSNSAFEIPGPCVLFVCFALVWFCAISWTSTAGRWTAADSASVHLTFSSRSKPNGTQQREKLICLPENGETKSLSKKLLQAQYMIPEILLLTFCHLHLRRFIFWLNGEKWWLFVTSYPLYLTDTSWPSPISLGLCPSKCNKKPQLQGWGRISTCRETQCPCLGSHGDNWLSCQISAGIIPVTSHAQINYI